MKKIVIIGIGNVGFSILKELYRSEESIEIVAIDRMFPTHLEEFINKNNTQNNIHFIQSDVTDEMNIRHASKDDRLAVIDVLICTVGILSKGTDFHDYRKEFHINLFGNITPIQTLIDKIPEKANSRIIILSSISGNIAPTDPHSYAPSKWALENFSSSLRQECQEKGIYIDIVRPTNILNKYSDVFIINKGIKPELVAERVIKQVKLTLNESAVSGKNYFVPNYLWVCRFMERTFPGVLNRYFGLEGKFKRKKTYKSSKINSVLISDVNSNLGKHLAQIYAREVDELIICDSDENNLLNVKTNLSAISNCKVISRKLEMNSTEAVSSFLKDIEGRVDLLINTSNKCVAKPIKATTTKEYIEMLDVNFLCPVLLTQDLISNNSMHKVVNILPDDAIYGKINHGAYSASKAALWAYLKSMRRQKGNTIHFLEVFLNNVNMKFPNMEETEKIAQRIFKAERSGRDVLMISISTRLSLLLQNFAYPIFKKTKLNK